MQGVADSQAGTVVWSPVFRTRNISVSTEIEQRLGIPCRVANDANMIAEGLIGVDLRDLALQKLPLPLSREYDGFECAIWDAFARAAGLPLHALLGGKLRLKRIFVPVDGSYSVRTRAGVRILQRKWHMKATGVADAALLARLGIKVRAVASAPAAPTAPTAPAAPSGSWKRGLPCRISSPAGSANRLRRWNRVT